MSKILVIDDEKEHISMFRYRFEALGHTLVEAHDGKEGLEMVEKEKPDLIFLDLVMPEMNGLEVCRALKGDPQTKNIPIIVISAVGELDMADRCLKLGADDFVRKPFEGKELMSKVEKHLKQK